MQYNFYLADSDKSSFCKTMRDQRYFAAYITMPIILTLFLISRSANGPLSHVKRIILFGVTKMVILIDMLEGFQQAADYNVLDRCIMPRLGAQQRAGPGDGGADCE